MKILKILFKPTYKVKDYKSFAFAIVFYVLVNIIFGLAGYLMGFVPYVGFVFFIVFGVLSGVYSLTGVIISFVSLIKKSK